MALLTPRVTSLTHLLRDTDLSKTQFLALLDSAAALKQEKRAGRSTLRLSGKNIAVIFEKPSTRTRSAFEVALNDLGAGCTYMDSASSHLGSAESFEDTAKVLGRFFDGIAYRGFEQSSIDEISQYAGVPVWNALTDQWHPTQALADVLTMRENSRGPLEEVSVAFLGDGRNNVARSLLTSAAILGMDVRIGAPAALQPDAETVATARRLADASGAHVLITDDVDACVRGADFLYTDVWVSMGEGQEQWDERIPLLRPYRVDAQLMQRTGNPETRFLHCLPSIHDRHTDLGRTLYEKYGLDGAEVSDEVFRSTASLVYAEAENRMHTIKAVLLASLQDTVAPHLDR
jgi:ornithine carbamoyltransferase